MTVAVLRVEVAHLISYYVVPQLGMTYPPSKCLSGLGGGSRLPSNKVAKMYHSNYNITTHTRHQFSIPLGEHI